MKSEKLNKAIKLAQKKMTPEIIEQFDEEYENLLEDIVTNIVTCCTGALASGESVTLAVTVVPHDDELEVKQKIMDGRIHEIFGKL